MTIGKIVLVGCSWGCGEWSYDQNSDHYVSHPGLSEYLSVDHNVLNLSRGGNSNWQICYTLENYLNVKGDDKNTTYIVVQTDPMRGGNSENFNVNYKQHANKADSLLILYQSLLEEFYHKLQYIGNMYNINIQLIGGISDVFIEGLDNITRVNVLCPSWINLIAQTIDSNFKSSNNIIPIDMRSEMLTRLRNYKKQNMLNEAMNHIDAKFLFRQQLIESEYFGPIHGDFHPNRVGHLLLYNYIKTKLKKIL